MLTQLAFCCWGGFLYVWVTLFSMFPEWWRTEPIFFNDCWVSQFRWLNEVCFLFVLMKYYIYLTKIEMMTAGHPRTRTRNSYFGWPHIFVMLTLLRAIFVCRMYSSSCCLNSSSKTRLDINSNLGYDCELPILISTSFSNKGAVKTVNSFPKICDFCWVTCYYWDVYFIKILWGVINFNFLTWQS